ncbi:viral replication protein [Lawsonibacter sp. OA9]|uniref:viral replication protein n=1 Tax=Lawsonibacter sp. OA9 TaxID=2914163 RepID=UPI001F06DFDC|nr:viral replication protein [Lawsonibacter sp. OA9]MCH1978753.1 viral replication protein [Lawsonibacter sp. OA9]
MTINNPQDCGLDRDRLLDILSRFSLDYFALCDEIATTGTPHTHVFLYAHSNLRFSTIHNRLPTAHIERALGTVQQNRDYLAKAGKWADTQKAETRVEGSFYEWGTVPTEQEERSPAITKLLQNIKDGCSTMDIIEETPGFAFKIRDIDTLRETIMASKYRSQNRDLTVYYLYGASGVGKTRGIYQKHPAEDICRITDYGGKNGVRFDAYHRQTVLVFEEFHSQIPIESMLNYLDIYPLTLPARYSDKTACYTTVYITSNISLEEQYPDIQRYKLETWRAFLRRIHTVIEYLPDSSKVTHKKGGSP